MVLRILTGRKWTSWLFTSTAKDLNLELLRKNLTCGQSGNLILEDPGTFKVEKNFRLWLEYFAGYIDLSKRRVSPEEIKKCEEKFTKAKTVCDATDVFTFIINFYFIYFYKYMNMVHTILENPWKPLNFKSPCSSHWKSLKFSFVRFDPWKSLNFNEGTFDKKYRHYYCLVRYGR